MTYNSVEFIDMFMKDQRFVDSEKYIASMMPLRPWCELSILPETQPCDPVNVIYQDVSINEVLMLLLAICI